MNARVSQQVLLVEDDELVRELVEAQLAALGFEVCGVADGPAALAELHRPRGFDVLVTDVSLPGGMSGYQLAERARAQVPDLPVLFASGHAQREPGEGPADGASYLQKPFRLDQLDRALREILR